MNITLGPLLAFAHIPSPVQAPGLVLPVVSPASFWPLSFGHVPCFLSAAFPARTREGGYVCMYEGEQAQAPEKHTGKPYLESMNFVSQPVAFFLY